MPLDSPAVEEEQIAGESTTVEGNKTNDGAVPGATNVGTLPAVATASAPTHTEGRQVGMSTDLSGGLRTQGPGPNPLQGDPIDVRIVNSSGVSPRRYRITFEATGSGTVGRNIAGVRHLAASDLVRIYYIGVSLGHVGGVGNGNPISIYRASSVAGGTLVTVADIPKLDTTVADSELEIRIRSPDLTGTRAAQALLTLGGLTPPGGIDDNGNQFVYQAWDWADAILLQDDEGLFITQNPRKGAGNNRYAVTIAWEEIP